MVARECLSGKEPIAAKRWALRAAKSTICPVGPPESHFGRAYRTDCPSGHLGVSAGNLSSAAGPRVRISRASRR
jgi:hypothetical protein